MENGKFGNATADGEDNFPFSISRLSFARAGRSFSVPQNGFVLPQNGYVTAQSGYVHADNEDVHVQNDDVRAHNEARSGGGWGGAEIEVKVGEAFEFMYPEGGTWQQELVIPADRFELGFVFNQ